MSGIRKTLNESTGKRVYEEEQWHVSGFKPSTPPKKARIAVPDQQNFTEKDCNKSLIAQVGGLRAENASLRADNLKLKQQMRYTQDDNDVLLRKAQTRDLVEQALKDEKFYRAQDQVEFNRKMADMKDDYNELLARVQANNIETNYAQQQVADLQRQLAEKERMARAFQLEMNDKLNSFLAVDLANAL